MTHQNIFGVNIECNRAAHLRSEVEFPTPIKLLNEKPRKLFILSECLDLIFRHAASHELYLTGNHLIILCDPELRLATGRASFYTSDLPRILASRTSRKLPQNSSSQPASRDMPYPNIILATFQHSPQFWGTERRHNEFNLTQSAFYFSARHSFRSKFSKFINNELSTNWDTFSVREAMTALSYHLRKNHRKIKCSSSNTMNLTKIPLGKLLGMNMIHVTQIFTAIGGMILRVGSNKHETRALGTDELSFHLSLFPNLPEVWEAESLLEQTKLCIYCKQNRSVFCFDHDSKDIGHLVSCGNCLTLTKNCPICSYPVSRIRLII